MRSRPIRLAWGVPPLIALALSGCTSDEASSTDTLRDAIGQADADNQIVDDVEITHDPVSGDLSIGGIELTGLDYFKGLDFAADNDNDQIPLTWPILRLSIGFDTTNPLSGNDAGVVVLEQTSMATDDANRRLLFDQGFLVTVPEGSEVTESGMVTGTVDGTSRTCWWEARRGVLDRLIMIFAGDGVASSLISTTIKTDSPTTAEVAADFAEAACGARPEGA
ncbi:MAG: hypothetical protein AB8G14_12720 [Ilumatobacter sp.]